MDEFAHIWAAQRRARRLRIGAWTAFILMIPVVWVLACMWLGNQLDVLGTNADEFSKQVQQHPESTLINPAERDMIGFVAGP